MSSIALVRLKVKSSLLSFAASKSFKDILIVSLFPLSAFILTSPVIPFKSPKSDKLNVVTSPVLNVIVGSLIRPVVKSFIALTNSAFASVASVRSTASFPRPLIPLSEPAS